MSGHDREVRVFGLWVFLLTEVMLFGPLFVAYAIYRMQHPAAFAEGSAHLDRVLGTINTAVLLGSSLCVALGVRAAEAGASARRWLWIAAALGAVFLAIKGFEYHHKFTEHLVPGLDFHGAAPMQLFFVLYFVMTLLHGVHIVVGLTLLAGAAVLAPSATTVELVGLYWHFVDVVWVFLFPLLYLVSR